MDHHKDWSEHHAKQEDRETFNCLEEVKKLVEAKLALPSPEEIKITPRNSFHRRLGEKSDSSMPEVLCLAKGGPLKHLKTLIGKNDAESISVKAKDGKSALHFAASGGHTEICEYLIFEHQFDVNIKDSMGRTPLHEAASGNHGHALSFLLDNGADLNAQASMGLTALHFAAEAGSLSVISDLISRRLAVDLASDFGTPLGIAAIQNQEKAMIILLGLNANPNIFPDGMLSPLQISILTHSHKQVKLLLMAGADPNIKSCRVSPLEAAIKCGDQTIVEQLINGGANLNVMDDYGLNLLELAGVEKNHDMVRKLFLMTSHISTIHDRTLSGILRHCESEEVVKRIRKKAEEVYSLYKLVGQKAYEVENYYTSFVWYTKEAAARVKEIQNHNEYKLDLPSFEKIKMLIQAKMAVFRSRDLYPESPDPSTDEVIINAARCGELAKLKQVISNFGYNRVHFLSNVKTGGEDTILHLAVAYEHTEIYEFLITELQFDINIKNSMGSTPLHHAAILKETATLEKLISHGADINAVTFFGQTALHVAAETGSLGAIHLLISKNLDVNATNDYGTPLCSAAMHKKEEALQLLLFYGADPNKVLEGAHSPLHYAIVSHSYGCIEKLFLANADPNIKSFGASPLATAIKYGDVRIIERLLKQGAKPNDKEDDGLFPLELAVLKGNEGMVEVLFPMTKPIPNIEDWSMDGVREHYQSIEVRKQILFSAKRYAIYDTKGQNAYEAGRYLTAAVWYKLAIDTNERDQARMRLRSSLCWAQLNDAGSAMTDAMAVAHLDGEQESFAHLEGEQESLEAICVYALAWILLGKFEKAAEVIEEACEKPESDQGVSSKMPCAKEAYTV